MARRDDYQRLAAYLAEQSSNRAKLTFGDIERILQVDLPESARQHPAWWANDVTHIWASQWLVAGWEEVELDLRQQVVTFRPTTEGSRQTPEANDLPAPLPQPRECDRRTVTRGHAHSFAEASGPAIGIRMGGEPQKTSRLSSKTPYRIAIVGMTPV